MDIRREMALAGVSVIGVIAGFGCSDADRHTGDEYRDDSVRISSDRYERRGSEKDSQQKQRAAPAE